MQKIIACAALFTTLVSSAYAGSKILTNYDQLLDALRQGDDVRAIISLDKCQPKSVKKNAEDPPDMTGVITRMDFRLFDHYKVQTDGQRQRYAIATSDTVLTEHRHFGLVYGYARMRVFEDNTVELHFAHYDPKSFIQRAQMNYTCQISDNMAQRGILLRDITG